MKTQNSGITTKGVHFTAKMKIAEDFDHYGRLEDVIELKYIGDRTVVLFKCYWYDQDRNRKRGPKDDGNFISVNTTAQWYKDEPYILATQASKVIFLNDRNNNGWQYVQKFQQRNIFVVAENEEAIDSGLPHQDDLRGCTVTSVVDVDDNSLGRRCGQVDFIVEASVVDKHMNKLILRPDESRDTDDAEAYPEDLSQSEYMDLPGGAHAESVDSDDD